MLSLAGLVPLHNACSYGHFEVCELLINAGANVNATDYWQFTPLHEAATKLRIDVCSLLLRHGANPYLRNCHGKTAIDSVACHAVRARIVAEYRGYTFLQYIQQGQYNKAKKLLQGPIATVVQSSGRQCTSASCSAAAMAGVLGPGDYDMNSSNCPSELVCSPNSSSSIVDQTFAPMTNSNSDKIPTDQQLLCTVQLNDTAEGAPKAEANIIESSLSSITASRCLSPGSNLEQLYQVRESHANLPPSGQPSTTTTTLTNAALLTCPSTELIHFKHAITGNGALHAIANADSSVSPSKRKQITEFLIKKGALVNERNNDYLAPLAVALDNSYYEVAECLLKNGARVNIADGLGQTCLHRMAIKGNVQAVQVSLN